MSPIKSFNISKLSAALEASGLSVDLVLVLTMAHHSGTL